MRVVIIEDEMPAAEKLRGFIARYDSSIDIAATLDSLLRLREWFSENPLPDLIFSDIELLDGNVFEFFEKEKFSKPVIFITAYDKFLLRAFELNGIGYLLKPYTYRNFTAAMLKLDGLRENFSFGQTAMWEEIQRQLAGPKYKERFVVKLRGGIQFIETGQIAYFRIQDGMLFAFGSEDKKFLLSENMNKLESIVDPKTFFRLNRSEMVNLNYIERLEPYFNNRLIVRIRNSKAELISSISRTPDLRHWIDSE